MPETRLQRKVGTSFDLRLTLFGHGWIDLAPFRWDADAEELSVPIPLGRRTVDVRVRHRGAHLVAWVTSRTALRPTDRQALRRQLARMLRLDVDLRRFWELCAAHPRLAWVARREAGRILRGCSVFEDLMKLLFTTNCSWSATRLMSARLVEALGVAAPSGRRAFPTPAACAAQDEAFYRDVVRCGYRAGSCLRLADAFASGSLQEDWFAAPDLPVELVRERLLALPGFGPYAAGQALRLLGHYEDLALDSWCRGRLAERAPSGKVPSDASVARTYAAFAPYAGLALWMDLTAAWHGEDP